MKTRLIVLALLAAGNLQAEVDRTRKPQPEPAPSASFPDFQQHVLPNGLKVFVIEDDRKPTVTFRLLVKAGVTAEGKLTGLSDFVASLLNRGTGKRSADEFAEASDFIGMKFEAMAGPDSIALSATGLTRYTEEILGLFSDAVLNPAYPADQFKLEQRKALSALEGEKQDPAKLADKLVGKVLYGAHPYGAYSTPQTVASISRADLVDFHKAQFLPNNATLAIVGDVKTAEILDQIQKAFGEWKPGKIPAVDLPDHPKISGVTIHLVDRPGSVQSNIVVCEPGPPRNNGSTPELNVLNSTLGGGFSGRLFQNLRETHAWTYGAGSNFDMRKYAGSFEASTETRNEVTHLAIGAILTEIERLRTEEVPEKELDLQRQYNIGNYLLSLENTGRTAQRVQDIDLYDLPADFYKSYAKRMETASPASTLRLAQRILSAEDVVIAVVGEAKDIQPGLEKLGKVQVYDTELRAVERVK